MNLNEVFDQGTLWNCEGLSYNDVVFVREKIKCKLNKICASRLIELVNTEQVNNDGIVSLERYLWYLVDFEIRY